MNITGTKRHAMLAAALLAAGLTVGCQREATVINPTGPETITTVEGINIQDWSNAATELSESLLDANVLGEDGEPSLIAISSFVNNTTQHVDRDLLLGKIRTVLNRSGKANTITTMDVLGPPEDAVAAEELRRRAAEDPDVEMARPEYTLTLKIIEDRVRAGNVRQAAYAFQMALTDTRNGVAVWEDEKIIAKKGERAAVGW